MGTENEMRKIIHEYAMELQRKAHKAPDVPAIGGMLVAGCAALPYHALKKAGAKTTFEYGITGTEEDVIYKWGEEIDKTSVQAGDILQLDMHHGNLKEIVLLSYWINGEGWFSYEEYEEYALQRNHHSAIVHSNFSEGKIMVLEQHCYHKSGRNKNLVDFGDIYVNEKKLVSIDRGQRHVLINRSWADRKIKDDPGHTYAYEHFLKLFNNQHLAFHVSIGTEIKPKGNIHAFKPVALA